MKKHLVWLTVTAAVGLSGCTAVSDFLAGHSLSKQECQVANWYDIGRQDGAAGYSGDRLAKHTKACARVQVTPNQAQWEEGRQAGLLSYCTTENAYRIGKEYGHHLSDVCPSHLVPRLRDAASQGIVVYTAYKELNDQKELLKQKNDEYKELKSDLEALIQGDNLGFEDEQEARAYLLALPDRIDDLVDEIIEIERHIADLEENLPSR